MTEVYTELLQENSELEAKILRLEQENNSLQAQLNNITVQSNNAITALEQERNEWKKKYEDVANENLKEIYELIKKNDCWRGVVNVVCSKLEQENKELKGRCQKLSEDLSCSNGCLRNKIDIEIICRSALEEIREILLEHSCTDSHTIKYIIDKINEVLNEN